ncbi:MAG: response regulator transcription factor [Chloroflexi bacterium]|nr:response regulator transcription factor [Chloroflexota bacterium]OJV88259.1 MAG: DNA-binding response regulator [Chloroflexi bacterium 54-19]
MEIIRVLLADDHALVRAGFRTLLRELGIEVVAEASDGLEALNLIALHRPDVVLMDVAMPGLNGLETTARIAQEFPTVRVIILSMHASAEYARRALRAGAVGYLLKNSNPVELEIAIKAATRDETYLSPAVAKFIAADYATRGNGEIRPVERLTPRQLEILQLLALGYTRKQIAEKLSISVKTFDTYRAQLMEQLGISDGAGLVRYVAHMGLFSQDE